VTSLEQSAGLWNLDGPARDDIVLPFQVEALGARGRLVRLGDVATDILSRHDYPAPVTRLLGEALALTAMLGAALKFEGKLILQTKTDGPVDMLVVDFEAPGGLRGYAHFDEARVAEMSGHGVASPETLLGHGHLAMTIDPGPDMDRYQGVVPLEGTSLSEAAHTYFRQSEQIPTEVRLAVAPHYVQRQGGQHAGWRVGGLIVQHLPEDGGIRMPDFPDGRSDAPDEMEDDRWTRARVLMRTVEDHELLDPTLSPERLLYRLYHEDGVRAFPPQELSRQCRCSRQRIETMLRQFSADDRDYMVEDGRIKVTCEFCNASYTFDPAELDGE
jgi:molecular chaperone Hsp33